MIVLANRPGFPFLGNDFFGTLGKSAAADDNPKDSNASSSGLMALTECFAWALPLS